MAVNKIPPVLVRPVPRRPFRINVASSTPPDELPSPPPLSATAADDRSVSGSRLLDPRSQGLQDGAGAGGRSEPGSGTLSPAQSVLNLTSSTLFGIYSPTITGSGRGIGVFAHERDDPGTPWGAAAQSPREGLSLHPPESDLDEHERDEALNRLRQRLGLASKPYHGLSHAGHQPSSPRARSRHPLSVLALGAKAGLLFTLGVGYGMLVARLRDERVPTSVHRQPLYLVPSPLAENPHALRYVAFWGCSAVLLGSLLPWFDHFWARAFGCQGRVPFPGQDPSASSASEAEPETDWALLIRGVGVFAGIVFAIRKLPWASTMQVSLTLALVNPFLWYLIDRSKSGFTLASAVGVLGTAVIAGVDPDMMPAPTAPKSGPVQHGDSDHPSVAPVAGHATVETVIWMLSVLFCSCVCFGNIGRRLALSTSAMPRCRSSLSTRSEELRPA